MDMRAGFTLYIYLKHALLRQTEIMRYNRKQWTRLFYKLKVTRKNLIIQVEKCTQRFSKSNRTTDISPQKKILLLRNCDVIKKIKNGNLCTHKNVKEELILFLITHCTSCVPQWDKRCSSEAASILFQTECDSPIITKKTQDGQVLCNGY